MKPKIPPKRVPSDDCIVHVDRVTEGDKVVEPGQPYAVHKGEWVEVFPIGSIRQYLGLSAMLESSRVLQDKDVDDDTKVKELDKLEASLDIMCEDIANRIANWNWTDLMGNPLPNPYGKPEVIKSRLSMEEIAWLRLIIQGRETPTERKNDSAPSTDT